jgi:DNA mismatch repair protein MutS2
MDQRALRVLEFDRIRQRLARSASFSVGEQLALALQPTDDARLAREWQAETREAVRLLNEKNAVELGGVHDLRPFVDQAVRGSALVPLELLDVRSTLQAARNVQRVLIRQSEGCPHLADIAERIAVPREFVEEIGLCIDDRGEVLETASEALGHIRRELREAHSRLLDRMQRIVASPDYGAFLQEPIVTQRQGRYVIPLRVEFKGRIPGLVQDLSGSGATLFIEPLAVVELNNRWREAQLAEEAEIRRILARLTAMLAEHAEAVRATVGALGDLDLILAKARYADELHATEPVLHGLGPLDPQDAWEARAGDAGPAAEPRRSAKPPGARLPSAEPRAGQAHPGTVLDLRQARHPLLDPLTVVPVDIHLDDSYYMLLITGPNTGGKTVALKTAGLLVLMAQSGLQIPAADGSAITVFEDVLADIGDEQSIEQSLSTFSSHMTHIIGILQQATPMSLVLLDELGAGTDPEEGAALAQALLNMLLERRITTLATTHYSELKLFAHNTPFVQNASVEFDLETLSPTYRLTIGLPGRSNALAIARRLGLPEAVVQQAEGLVSSQTVETETMLAEIKRAREAAWAAESGAQAAQREAEAMGAALRQRLAETEEKRREVINEARAQAAAELEALREDVARVRERAAGIPTREIRHETWLAEAEAVLARRAAETRPVPPPEASLPLLVDGPVQAGDRVWVPALQASGEVVSATERDVEVRVGSFRTKLPAHRVELRERGGREAVQVAATAPRPPSPGMELDLRGLSVDETLIELDRYLDTAYLAGLPFVRIIHGKGTGALRQAVREAMRDHPLVTSFRSGEAEEGGNGVTVANLAPR